jgi:hypothetical protein
MRGERLIGYVKFGKGHLSVVHQADGVHPKKFEQGLSLCNFFGKILRVATADVSDVHLASLIQLEVSGIDIF